MKKFYIPFLIMALAFPVLSSAQCKSFVKSKCVPELENYVPSDKFNSLRMVEGEEAEVNLIFVANHDYRVLICSQEILGNVEYEILTDRGQVIYSSKDNEGKSYFDFSTTSTEKLQVIIRVSESESTTGMMHEGCVTVMVGSVAS
jgi:hypothetical protein